jgi:hypothetical protein
MTPPHARLFVQLWEAFTEGVGIDASEVEGMIEATGLVEWRPATAADVAYWSDRGWDFEEGDPALLLTEQGRQVWRQGSGLELGGSDDWPRV